MLTAYAAPPRPVDAGYRAPEVCRLAGVSYRQLDYWARTALLAPSLRAARGSGTQRLYSRHDVAVVVVIARLLEAGASLQRLRRAVPELRAELARWQGPLDALWVVVDAAGDAMLARTVDELAAVLEDQRRPAYLVPVDVDAALAA